ncbi:MAG: hypothetical protein GX113_01120 [Actinobacteria bacterium]|nr:hypothetical protein [Actinomycetota bacterium]
MAKRIVLLIVGSLLFTALLTTAAMAGPPWTPQDIYDDFVQNGKLTRDYTDAELKAYLNDATIAQYGGPIKDRLDDAVMDLLDRDEFPFTGFQLMMAGIVVVVLIGGGVMLRLLTRPKKSSESS